MTGKLPKHLLDITIKVVGIDDIPTVLFGRSKRDLTAYWHVSRGSGL